MLFVSRAFFVFAGSCLTLSLVWACARKEAPAPAASRSAPGPAQPAPTSALRAASAAKVSASPAGGSEVCARMCAIMQSLHCPNDPPDCIKHCEEMRLLPVCGSQMGAFIECVAARSAAECHCNEDGESEVRGNTCDSEQEAVAHCIEHAS